MECKSISWGCWSIADGQHKWTLDFGLRSFDNPQRNKSGQALFLFKALSFLSFVLPCSPLFSVDLFVRPCFLGEWPRSVWMWRSSVQLTAGLIVRCSVNALNVVPRCLSFFFFFFFYWPLLLMFFFCHSPPHSFEVIYYCCCCCALE